MNFAATKVSVFKKYTPHLKRNVENIRQPERKHPTL
jgi:hypothetical protein